MQQKDCLEPFIKQKYKLFTKYYFANYLMAWFEFRAQEHKLSA